MSAQRARFLWVLLALSTCDSEQSAECEPSDEPSSLAIDNRSGVLVESIVATACDGGQEHALVLPEDGIAFSSQATVELPGPGCWQLTWSGEACGNDPPYRTSADVCGGEAYAWTISIDDRECEGGW